MKNTVKLQKYEKKERKKRNKVMWCKQKKNKNEMQTKKIHKRDLENNNDKNNLVELFKIFSRIYVEKLSKRSWKL